MVADYFRKIGNFNAFHKRIMKKNLSLLLGAGLLLAWLAACDYVDPNDALPSVVVEVPSGILDTSFLLKDSVQKSMAIVEEYTGHFCGNCPNAARQAKRLDSIYNNRLLVLAIHAGYFSEPQTNADGSFGADFRSEAGNNLDTKFKVSETIPKGLVNRGRFGGSSTALLASSSWEGKITELLAKPDPEFTLYLNAFYNDSAKQFYARTHVKMRSSFSLPLKMEVYLVEDSIINWQLDYAKQPQRNPNYLHQHILRDGFTPIGGSESPGIAPYPAGKISAGRWVCQLRQGITRKKCKVIALVVKEDTDEVLHAIEGEIKDQ